MQWLQFLWLHIAGPSYAVERLLETAVTQFAELAPLPLTRQLVNAEVTFVVHGSGR